MERIGSNAYVIDLPPEWNISNTFNVLDLIEFQGSPNIPSEMFEPSPILLRDTTLIQSNIPSKIGKEKVDYIVDDQIITNPEGNERKFLVKWKYLPLSDSCWISSSDLFNYAPKLWEKFFSGHNNPSSEMNSSSPDGNGGDTSITREAPKEASKHYNLRRNARIRCHPYEVNNMLILTKKFKTLLLEDISISKDFEDMKRSRPMKMGAIP